MFELYVSILSVIYRIWISSIDFKEDFYFGCVLKEI